MKIVNTRVSPPSWVSLQIKEATHMKAHLKFLYSAALLAAALMTAIVPAGASAAIDFGPLRAFRFSQPKANRNPTVR